MRPRGTPGDTVAIVGAGPIGLAASVLTKTLRPEQLITHRFALEDVGKAYETFGSAAKERALKVLMTAPGA